jgi:hypothetical protein
MVNSALALLCLLLTESCTMAFLPLQQNARDRGHSSVLSSSSVDLASQSSPSAQAESADGIDPASIIMSKKFEASSQTFLLNTFLSSSPTIGNSPNECDDVNRPPSLNMLLRTLHQLTHEGSSTDIRGRFVDHKRVGTVASVAHEIG